MESFLIWNEDSNMVYGYKGNFNTKEDFIEQVKSDYKDFYGNNCIVKDVKVESCIQTEKGLPGDIIVPLSATDVEIANYYTATVEETD